MGLTEYRRKRDFKKTAEPRGKTPAKREELSFVIQKHAASHLHYDFRLEVDGVLKSWAVPKGPDLDPATKRLAMRVEDHPIEYGDFEGTIPKGEYGGGTVMLWDHGTWEPMDDPKKGLKSGQLKFVLHGEKLKGAWMLVRKGGRSTEDSEKAWFLFKERDEFAKPGKKAITDSMPLSVTTGRDLDEIAAQSDRVWGPKGEVKQKSANGKRTSASAKKKSAKTTTKKSARKSTATTSKNETASESIAGSISEVHGVTISHPTKILYAEQGITKAELALYYELVAKWMLPHVENRPLALVRCPNGRAKACFFQKHPSDGLSEDIHTVDVAESGTAELNMYVDSVEGLISFVQMGVLEIHSWGSTTKNIEKPNQLVFDLDPDTDLEWKHVVSAAREVRLVLKELGLECFLKTTGGKGLHLMVPILPRLEWPEVKSFCHDVAKFMETMAPDRYVSTMSKAKRTGKIFIDYLRNGRGATAIAAYSTRARENATISVPIAWEELTPKLQSDSFNIRNIADRLGKLKGDPWGKWKSLRQSISAKTLKQLEKALKQAGTATAQ